MPQVVIVATSSPETYQQSVARSVRGIIFFGTPHSGSGWAVLAKGLGTLASLSLIKKPNKEILRILDRHSDTLVALQSDFLSINRRRALDDGNGIPEILLLALHEELAVKGIGNVSVDHALK